MTARTVEGALRRSGHKLTRQRRAVLNAIAANHDHLTPAGIHEKARQESPGIGLVTVYRTLGLLDSLGMVCEVHSAGNCKSYLMRRPSGHHHHLVCTGCGTVADFTECDVSDLAQRLARETGFDIRGHILEFSGLCEGCRKTDCAQAPWD